MSNQFAILLRGLGVNWLAHPLLCACGFVLVLSLLLRDIVVWKASGGAVVVLEGSGFDLSRRDYVCR